MSNKVFVGRRMTGRVVQTENGPFYISHRWPEHFCIKYHGWGVTKDLLEQLAFNDVWMVRVVYHGTNGTKRFEAPVRLLLEEGIEDSLGGFERQVFLPLEKWYQKKVGGD
jgi:hypothetical protein